MAQPQDDLWHDVSIVLKHIRFIIVLFVLALAAAALTGLTANTQNRAKSEAEVDLRPAVPVANSAAAPTLHTIEDLAGSDAVIEAAAEKADIEPDQIRQRVQVDVIERDRRFPDSVDRIVIEASGGSRSQAGSTVTAFMDAMVEAVDALRSDPEKLESLRQEQDLALQRFQQFDQAKVLELGQVQSDLNHERSLLSSLTGETTLIDQALALIDANSSRPVAELITAISGLLGNVDGGAGLPETSSVASLRAGLQLRRDLVQELIEHTQSGAQTLAQREQELLAATAGQGEALSIYTITQRDLQAAELTGELSETKLTVTVDGVNISSGVNWLARLGAGAAFALVAGVAGAFALEFLHSYWQRWRRGDPAPEPEDR